MKKIIIRIIGILLIVFGTIRAFACLRVVFVFVPIVLETQELARMGTQAALLNLGMTAIVLVKVAGGVGLLWLKMWAKWTVIIGALSHVLFLSYFGIPIWIQMFNGSFENPYGLPMWKDHVNIALQLAVVVMILICMKKSDKTEGTTSGGTERR